MSNLKRLEKYRNELENHLEEVNRNLDEEIQRMRERIKKIKEQCSEKKTLTKGLTIKVLHLQRKIEEEDRTPMTEKTKDSEMNVAGDEDGEDVQLKLENYKKKSLELQNEIIGKTNMISELINEARKENILQETRSLRSILDKVREDVEDSVRKKTAQDSAIERLRADISLAEESQALLEELLTKEIQRRVEQTSEAVDLKEQMDVFERESVQIRDEFSNLLSNLKDKDMRITRLESDVGERKKRLKKLNKMNDEYMDELRRSIERTKLVLQQEEDEIQKCDQFLKNETNTLTKMEKKYKDLKKKKCLKEESDVSELESDSDFDKNLKDITKKNESIARKLMNKRKQIGFSLTTKSSLIDSKAKDTNLIPSMKKSFLNLRREQIALEFKIQSLKEKKNLLSSKVENILKDNERLTADLRKAEEVKETLCREIAKLEVFNIESTGQNKDKTEKERKVELVKEAIRKQVLQNDQLRQKAESLRNNLSALKTKIRMLGDVNVEEAESLREVERVNLRRLRNLYGDLMKKAKKTERELELCIIQRESAVNRAKSVVHLVTTVKAEREHEIKDIRRRVADKRQMVERTLSDMM